MKILSNTGSSSDNGYLYTIMYYDDYSRPIQVWSKHSKGWDVMSTKYDFAGQVLNTERIHLAQTANELKISNRYVYDHAGRKKEVYQMMEDIMPEVMLASYNYDELGQLIEKNLHQTSPTARLQSVDYRYNIRGWLTSINNSKLNADPSVGSESDDAFGMELYYNTGFTTGTVTGPAQYNGNISGMAWKTKGPGVAYTSVPSNAYAFNYDKLNRLELANYATSPTSNDSYNTYDGRYNESLTYDEMGNIKTLSRKGMQGVLDNLSYTYLEGGHRLGKVTDLTTDAAGFNDLNKAGDDYTYDSIGNLVTDRNKGLGISYNVLNLPQQVTRTSDSKDIKFVYDATGRKLRKVHDGVNHYYIDGIEYSDDNLLFIATEEGRVRKHETTGSWVYDYFLKDHLGNVRVVLTAAPPTIDSYPAATMETMEAAVEQTFYANLPETRRDKPSGFDGYTDANPLNLKVAELGALSGKKVGPSITLKVNAGDKLTLSAKSFYNSQASYSRDQLLPEMLLMLLDGLMNPTGLTGQSGTVAREAANYQVFGSSNSYNSALSSIADNVYNSTESKPKAFMVWMLFDNEFNLVKSSSGMLQVGEAGSPAKNMVQDNLVMERGGYFYAYLVNESPTSVYFDDFQVTHNTGKVLEENHYYPFGMLNVQLSTQPTDKPLNHYKYNGKELQKELNLEWLDYGARFYDAQIGRWHAIDPLAEVSRRWSPYTYGYNSPTTVIDPDGMLAQSFIDELWNKSSDDNKWTNWINNDNGTFSSNGLNTDYRNRKGELLMKTEDGLSNIIIIPDNNLKQFESRVNDLNEKGKLENPGSNTQQLHSLGVEIDNLKDPLITGDPSNDVGISRGYEDGYNNTSHPFKLIVQFLMGADSENAKIFGGYISGKKIGQNDRENGSMNKLNPYKSLKKNNPLIILKPSIVKKAKKE